MKKWSSLKKHLQREHRSLLTFCTLLKRWICLTSHAFWLASDLHDGSAGGCHSEDKNSSDILYDGQLLTNSECDTVPSTPTIDPKWDQALFLLKATEQHSLTYSGIESLCESTQGLVETVLDQVASRVKKKLQEHNIEISTTLKSAQPSITDACQPADIFEGLYSRHSRERYYGRHFNYVVSYVHILLHMSRPLTDTPIHLLKPLKFVQHSYPHIYIYIIVFQFSNQQKL